MKAERWLSEGGEVAQFRRRGGSMVGGEVAQW
jgi:hypothetical protein